MDKKPDDRITELEEALAYLTRVTDDLSEVIARQDQDISRLTRRLDMLMRAEAERQSQSDGSIAVADQPPPHY
ncbi:SlyX family protein [Paracoccus sp. JM45]|uniref:SlyX family protein n=1 Tax=Paracoccus sp. JM45 TaxID=2283626 RepID=UPI000E6D108E|nr:SlyX family protein [Paracoccus sp. JM45]RJE81190.1 SlyX protein [Paracoccus sp. JM45]